jgi:hypothetical protein
VGAGRAAWLDDVACAAQRSLARGVPLEIQVGGVIIPDSPANRRLVAGLGAESEPVKRVFTPELSELIRPPRRRG